MSYKRFSLWLVCPSFVCALCMPILFFIYDPMQLYHKPYFREITFSQDMRIQNKGIIKHYDFNSFIIGSSMVEFVPTAMLNNATGEKWVNLMMYGSTFQERAVIMEYLFRQKEPKEIIYSLDSYGLIQPEETTISYEYIYNKNPFDDMLFYIQPLYIKCLMKWSKEEWCIGLNRPLTMLNRSLIEMEFLAKKFGGFEKWVFYEDARIHDSMESLRKYTGWETLKKAPNITSTKEYIQTHIFRFIKENPNTHFHFIIPPYSRLHWKLEKYEDFIYWRSALIWFVKECESYSNVTIYGFDMLDYTGDMANYTDTTHYNIDMHELFATAILTQSYIVKADSIQAYLDTLEEKIQIYNVAPLQEMIRAHNAIKANAKTIYQSIRDQIKILFFP